MGMGLRKSWAADIVENVGAASIKGKSITKVLQPVTDLKNKIGKMIDDKLEKLIPNKKVRDAIKLFGNGRDIADLLIPIP